MVKNNTDKTISTKNIANQLSTSLYNDRGLDISIPNEALNDAKINKQSLEQLTINTIEFKNEYAALGAMYVLEGATLGGSVIVKQLGVNPNFTKNFNFNYYNIYGKELILNWQQFLAYLNSLPQTNYTDVLSGALNMFKAIIAIAKQLHNTQVD